MMSGRSFDHMLGGLSLVSESGQKKYPKINGLTGSEANPDTQGSMITVQPNARYQGLLDPVPSYRFPGVDMQIFGGTAPGPSRVPTMDGFVKSYFGQTNDVQHSHNVMNYFTPDKLPVLTTLATEFAVFNGWFSSVAGPPTCNRSFAHYGTSFGQVGLDNFDILNPIPSIYERMIQAGLTAKIYYYDEQSSTVENVNLLKTQPQIFANYNQFIGDCNAGKLPGYSFIQPCFNDHSGPGGGMILASDQRPDHNVQEGERFIASTYNAIRANPEIWESTALLIVYDEHGGIYDHVPPPSCTPDSYVAKPESTGTGEAFHFDRLGVRVPAVLVSPYIPRGTVIPGPEDLKTGRTFEHASIPATITSHFLGNFGSRSTRVIAANTFLDLFSDRMRPDSDVPFFRFGASDVEVSKRTLSSQGTELGGSSTTSRKPKRKGPSPKKVPGSQEPTDIPAVESRPILTSFPDAQVGPSTHVARDRWTADDSLGHYPYAYAIYRFLTSPETKPPLAISIQAPWGGGKTSLMRMVQRQLDPETYTKADQSGVKPTKVTGNATVKDVQRALDQIVADPSARSKTTSSEAPPSPGNSNAPATDTRKSQ
jgi:phospholipase C